MTNYRAIGATLHWFPGQPSERAAMTLRDQEDPQEFGRQPNGRYLPGHAEIKQVCAEIRSGWSAAERIRRHRWARPAPVSLQVVQMAEPTVGILEP